MDTIVPNVTQLFGLPVQYVIPSYQRNYVWNREDHWLPLWEDVERIASQRMRCEENSSLGNDERDAIKPHFFGTLITKEIGTIGYVQKWVVIDGQQRLTTLQLMISASARVLRRHNQRRAAEQLKSLIINPDHMTVSESDQLKIEPKGKDYSSFTSVMNASRNDTEFEEINTIGSCHDYFENQINQWLDSNEYEIDKAGESLSSALREYLQFVEIRLRGGENEYMIFETLNARGEPLTEWEKSKNYLLSVAADLASGSGFIDQEFIYREYIDDFDEKDFWRTEAVQARFRGPNADLFFDYWMQIELGERISPTRLYREFRVYVEEKFREEKKYQDLMKRLSAFSSIFLELKMWPDDDSPLRMFLYHMETLRLEFLFPVLMLLKRRLKNDLQFDDCIKILDSYIMRRAATFVQNRGGYALVSTLLRIVSQTDEDNDVCGALTKHLTRVQSGARWPTDAEIYEACNDREFVSTADWSKARLLLEGVADSLTSSFASVPFDRRNGLTLEHVVPQSWEKHWGDQDEEFSEPFGWKLSRLTSKIGNFTLVTQSLNSSMSNKSWEQKREALKEDNLYLNRDVVQNVPDGYTWDEDQIKARGERLAKMICEIWPRPSSEE